MTDERLEASALKVAARLGTDHKVDPKRQQARNQAVFSAIYIAEQEITGWEFE